MKSVGVAEFKARCTKYLQEVVDRDESIVITKRGKRMAEVRRVRGAQVLREDLKGSILYHGSILSGVSERWDAGRP